MDPLTKYARREPTTDGYILKHAPKFIGLRFDVQIYNDKECTKPYVRIMWYQKRPKFTAKTVVLNSYRWSLVWIK